MACANHPEVLSGLDNCTACGKTFCIDCIVGRKSGWFCAVCDPEKKPRETPAAVAAFAQSPFGGVVPAKPKPGAVRGCTNHPDVLSDLYPCVRCDRTFCPDCLVLLKGSRFCAGCKTNAVKDMQSGLSATGSGLQLAGLGARIAAVVIDQFVMGAISMVFFFILIGIVAGTQSNPDSIVMPLAVFGFYGLMFASMFCYHALMLQWKGQTLGKMAVRIKVVTPEGGPISPGQAWIRVLVWFFLSGCLIDYLPAFFNDEKMAIHDMAARTRVVRVD